jgi:hypothetical protein
MPKVYNKYHGDAPPGAVYIGRPSPWGNPFVIHGTATREIVVELYSEFVENTPELKRSIQDNLRGKDLVCFCAPKACHGDVILRIANEEGIDAATDISKA